MKSKNLPIGNCRISNSTNLVKILSLGDQYLTGIFPKEVSQKITKGPLDLVWCPDSGLVQLNNSFDLNEMYGLNYGYRSGLNDSMVEHLKNKVDQLTLIHPTSSGDVVLDIGSNDGTLLSSYKSKELIRIGIDPTGLKFKEFYTDNLRLIPDFFSADAYRSICADKNASIITSISMFYDLESPSDFVADIEKILHRNGIWHFEQSYMPTMLRRTSYDTICHEHLEYYSLNVVKTLVEKHGLRVIDVQMNDVNGGSFAVTVARAESKYISNTAAIDRMLEQEDQMNLNTLKPYSEFEQRVFQHRDDLVRLIKTLAGDDKTIAGYGASTKGNVLLQFCEFSTAEISCIAEINPDKFGSFTPGTLIPIHSELEVRAMKPDYMLVLPWHFRDSIIQRESEYIANGGKLIFPLPEIEIV